MELLRNAPSVLKLTRYPHDFTAKAGSRATSSYRRRMKRQEVKVTQPYLRPRLIGLFSMSCLLVLWPLEKTASALDPKKAFTQLNRDTWTMQQGLPEDSVNAIAQTRDGYLWLATRGGLVRFD